jgi:hypothetical protein
MGSSGSIKEFGQGPIWEATSFPCTGYVHPDYLDNKHQSFGRNGIGFGKDIISRPYCQADQ